MKSRRLGKMIDPTSTRASVFVTFGVAILSIITGIINISYTPVAGTFADFIPALVRDAAGFTGTVTGFLMFLSAYALYQRYRVGYYTVLVLLPVTAFQGLIQSTLLSVPLVVLSVIAVPLVLLNRQSYTDRVALSSTQIAAGIALIGVQVYGTVGTWSLQDQFEEVSTILDAFYFTLVTASTVGYGDITATSQGARLFAMSVLVLGTASFAVAIGVLLGPIIEARLAASLGRVRNRQLDQLDDHVVILGYGDLTDSIIDGLTERSDFVVVTRDSAKVTELNDRGLIAVQGDPGDEAILERVGVSRSKAVIAATTDDADDAFKILTARELAPEVRIITTAVNAENVSKLRRAGADIVLDPAYVGAELLVDASRQGTKDPQIGTY